MRETVLSSRENYMLALLSQESSLKAKSREFADGLGLGRISINPAEACLIRTLVAMHGCRKFVEIGTLTGLSAQYIFEALPEGGDLWTLEKDPKHGDFASEIFMQLDQTQKRIHLVRGDAREELEKLSEQGPFDGVFIDGNKAAYFDYLLWAERNLRPGGLILADNVFLSGAVWGEPSQHFSDKQVRVMREFNQRLADPNLFTSAIAPTFEGLYIAIKKN